MINEINVTELDARLRSGEEIFILDVREPHEVEISNIEGAVLIPLRQLEDRLEELAAVRDKEIVVHCRTGGRSAAACELLMQHGFTNPKNLAGGINRWAQLIDPSLPMY